MAVHRARTVATARPRSDSGNEDVDGLLRENGLVHDLTDGPCSDTGAPESSSGTSPNVSLAPTVDVSRLTI